VRLRVAAALVAGAVAVSGGVAVARFTDATTARPTVRVHLPPIPRPNSVSCSNGFPIAAANFSWTDPPAPNPPPTGWVLHFRQGTSVVASYTIADPAVHSASLTNSLLGQILSGLLSIISQGNVTVTVNAVYGNYESPSLYTHRMSGSVLPLGIGCSAVANPQSRQSMDAISDLTATTTTTTVGDTTPPVPPTVAASTSPATTASTTDPVVAATTAVPITTTTSTSTTSTTTATATTSASTTTTTSTSTTTPTAVTTEPPP